MKRPNVIMIIADQMSTKFADGSGNNFGGLATPGLDRLSRGGIRFENSYSSYPLCCPARSSIFTGMMPHHTQILDNEELYREFGDGIPMVTDLPTLAEVLKENGYRTAYFGKEHAGGYGWKGCDEFGQMTYSAGGMLAEGSVYDQIFVRDAIDYIKKDHDKPFYMTLSLINPHDICKVLGGKVKGATIADAIFFCRDDNEKYLRGQERLGLPANHMDPVIPGMIDEKDYMFKELADRTEDEWRRYIGTYQLLIEKTDDYIRQVLDVVSQQGIEEETLILFTTDHGDMMGSHGIIAKTNFYEESVKTHLHLRYPKSIAEGQVNTTAMVGTADIMPTVLDLCGVEMPRNLKGRSFKNLCVGGNTEGFNKVYSENNRGRMIRTGDYKYIFSNYNDVNHQVLFDLEKDPGETTNRAKDPGYADIVKSLDADLKAWMADEGIGTYFEPINKDWKGEWK